MADSTTRRVQRAVESAAKEVDLPKAAAAAAAGAVAAGAAVAARRAAGRGASRAYRLQDGEPVPDEIRRVARGRIDHALDELTGRTDSTDEEAVHEARKDMKKLRALLRLVRDDLGDAVYRRENTVFRDAARSLSSSRDATVMLETLDELAEHDPGAASGAQALRRALEQRRSEQQPKAARSEAVAALRSARARIPEWPLELEGFDAVERGLERIYRRGRRRMRAAERDPGTAALHEWRKRVKDHWYHLTLLECAWPELMQPAADAAHDLSELLGDDHDLALLRDAAREHGAEALERAADARRAELQASAFVLGRRVYSERPRVMRRRVRSWWDAPARAGERVG